ncbi:MAG: gamma-glutamylcyclotransferase family protein [Limnochordia bacterium]
MTNKFILKRCTVDAWDRNCLETSLTSLKGVLTDTALDPEILRKLLEFQAEDGSFLLTDSWNMPADARVDYGYVPTYLGAAILMRAYLAPEPQLPREQIADALVRALRLSCKRRLAGHGYEAEEGTLFALRVFKLGGLRDFLEKDPAICPEFQAVVWSLIDEREAQLKSEGTIQGAWQEDYTDAWHELLEEIRPGRRRYLAYGSNMCAEQMRYRCPQAAKIGVTYLKDWSLRLYGVATIEPNPGDKTPAVIWEISRDDEKSLDRFEGYPECYTKQNFIVTVQGTRFSVMAYVMTERNKQRLRNTTPSEHYLEAIRRGYEENGLGEGRPTKRSIPSQP